MRMLELCDRVLWRDAIAVTAINNEAFTPSNLHAYTL